MLLFRPDGRPHIMRVTDTPLPDYYEAMQVSPRADQETIERVFRHLARRYHPDTQDSGNESKFTELVNANDVLSDPARRVEYDANYERVREARWRIFKQDSAASDITNDSRIRRALLSILYVARRNDTNNPGVGVIEIERLLDCAESTINFHTWYLRENGWIERLITGHYAISAGGVDHLIELGGVRKPRPHLLRRSNEGEDELVKAG